MTITAWQACLLRFETDGTPNERLMAHMLLSLSQTNDPVVERIFDAYASEILEAERA